MSHTFKPFLYFLLLYFVFNYLHLFLEFNPCTGHEFPLEEILISLFPIYTSFMTF